MTRVDDALSDSSDMFSFSVEQANWHVICTVINFVCKFVIFLLALGVAIFVYSAEKTRHDSSL